MSEPLTIKASEAAAQLGVSRREVYLMCERGELQHVRAGAKGRRVLITAGAPHAWLQRQLQAPVISQPEDKPVAGTGTKGKTTRRKTRVYCGVAGCENEANAGVPVKFGPLCWLHEKERRAEMRRERTGA